MNSLFTLIKDDLVLDIASQFQNMYLLLATMVHKTFKITKLKRLWTKNGCPFCSIKYSPILSASSTKTCSKDDFPKPKSLKLLSENLLWDFHDDPSLNKSPKKIDWFWTLHILLEVEVALACPLVKGGQVAGSWNPYTLYFRTYVPCRPPQILQVSPLRTNSS